MFAILFASIAPVIALMSFFYLKDRLTEPFVLTLKIFCMGALLVFPVMFIQYTFQVEGIWNHSFIQSFIAVGLIEELFKWLLFIYIVYRHTEFDAHYDGIVYAVAIGLGFAMLENVFYLLTNGIEYALTRAIFPVSSHALFGVMMGYYFGKAKMHANNCRLNICLAFIIPFLLHGVYNYILKTMENDWLFLLIPFMIVLWIYSIRQVKTANKRPKAQLLNNEQNP